MPAIVTFDPIALRVVEISTGGDNELDWIEVYSEWKEWAALSDNIKYPPAFRVVGGDPISNVQNLGSTFFLLYPWKFRPAELNHRLILSGNLFTDPAGESPFVPTLGTFSVLAESRVSNLVDASVARLDLVQLLDAIYIDTVGGDDANDGTNTSPVRTLSRAHDLSVFNNLPSFSIRGSVTLDRNLPRYRFLGASELSSSVHVNGFNVEDAIFERLMLTGVIVGSIEAVECSLGAVTGLNGIFRRCGMSANFATSGNAEVVFAACYSTVPGTATPVCVVGANNSISFRNWSGGLELQNVAAGSTLSVDLDPGRLVLGPSNTGGTVVVRGGTQLDDTSTGTAVTSLGLLERTTIATSVWADASATALASAVDLIRKTVGNRLEVDFAAQRLVLYDDNGTTILRRWPLATNGGEPVTTARGTQTKRGAPI